MRRGHTDKRQGRGSLRWIALGLWLALLLGAALIVGVAHGRTSSATYLMPVLLATVGVIGLVAFARMTSTPPKLRTLRVIAVLLPMLFVVCIEAILLIVEADDLFTEVGEHVLATAILSLSAIPFSIWIFRAFSALRDKLARRADQLETLHRASLAVAGEATSARVQQAIVEGVRAVVLADRAVLWIPAGAWGPETLTADPPVPAPDDRERELLRAARTLATASADEPGPAYLTVRTQGSLGPALLAWRPSGPTFGPEEVLILDMFAVAAAAGIESAFRLEEAQLLAMVEERERIARDLHDDLGQLLGFLTTEIQATQELVATGRPREAAEELAKLERATRTLSAQVREAILGLRTSVGPAQPLGRVLEEYTAEFGIQAGLLTSYDGSAEVGAGLPSATRYQVLRIAQEAMSNARRHASATMVAVALRETPECLELSVTDDGTGFDLATPVGSGNFGLKTMAERTRAVDGALEVRTAPGEGTTVLVTVPCERTEGG